MLTDFKINAHHSIDVLASNLKHAHTTNFENNHESHTAEYYQLSCQRLQSVSNATTHVVSQDNKMAIVL